MNRKYLSWGSKKRLKSWKLERRKTGAFSHLCNKKVKRDYGSFDEKCKQTLIGLFVFPRPERRNEKWKSWLLFYLTSEPPRRSWNRATFRKWNNFATEICVKGTEICSSLSRVPPSPDFHSWNSFRFKKLSSCIREWERFQDRSGDFLFPVLEQSVCFNRDGKSQASPRDVQPMWWLPAEAFRKHFAWPAA